MRIIARTILAVVAIASLAVDVDAQTGVQGVPVDRPDQQPAKAPSPPVPASGQPAIARDASAPLVPFKLTSIRVDGTTLPRPGLVASYRQFVGTTADAATLTRITNAIAGVYERSDVALYTVLVPKQTFAGGSLLITVVEGHLDAFEVRGNLRAGRGGLLKAYLRRLLTERPLRRSSLQRVVSLIRDVPGLSSDITFERGTRQGAVKLVVTARDRVVQAGLSVSDRGTALLGRTQVQADVLVNGILSGADQLHGSAVLPTNVNRFQYYSLSYLTPLDADGTTASITASHLRTRPAGLPLNGDATSLAIQVSHPVIRSYARNLYATVGLDGIDTNNALFGFTLSNDRVRAFRASLSYSVSGKRNQLTLGGTGSLGLDVLGARVTAGASDQRFRKLNLRLLDSLQVGRRFALRFDGVAQLSPDRLPSSEQLALGGEEFGRAYEAAIVAGDEGYDASLEFAWLPGHIPKAFKGSELYVYADDGETRFRSRAGVDAFVSRVASIGGGTRIQVAGMTVIQLEATRGLYNPVLYEDRKHVRVLFSLKSLFR